MQERLQVTTMATADLVPYAGNAKEHPQKQVEQIAASIEQFGFNDPVGIWHDETGAPVIVEGHGRVMAAKLLGLESVPVVALDHLDDEGRRAYGIAHNATNLSSGFDEDALRAELERIRDIDMGAFGIDPVAVLEQVEVTEDEPPAIEDVETRTHAGDAWKLGDHVLICGDATHAEDMARLFGGGESADLLLTDPPYNVDYAGKNVTLNLADKGARIQDDILGDKFATGAEYATFLEGALSNADAHMRAGAAFYVWFAAARTHDVFTAAAAAGFEVRQELYWIKQHFVLGRQDYQWLTEPCVYGWKAGAAHYFAPTHTERNVIDDAWDTARMTKEQLRAALDEVLGMFQADALREDRPLRNEKHPTMKPVRLFARLIRNSSRPGEVVLDPFAGSGTTLVACEQMGRRARVMELEPRYCDVILERWERMTGRAAERIG